MADLPACAQPSLARGVEMGFPLWLTKPLAWLIISMTSIRLGVEPVPIRAHPMGGKNFAAPDLFHSR